MKKFGSILCAYFQNSVAYRADLMLYSISGMALILLTLVTWLVIEHQTTGLFYSRSELIIYFLMILLVRQITAVWGASFIANDIRKGRLSLFLLKPVKFYLFQLGNNLAEKLYRIIITITILGLLGYLLKINIYDMPIINWVMFCLSVILAFVINFAFDLILGIAAFWLDDSKSLGELMLFFESLLSGRFIPLMALPTILSQLSIYLPFRYIYSFPVELYLGQLMIKDLVFGFGLQILWCITLSCLLLFMWKQGVKKYSASGA